MVGLFFGLLTLVGLLFYRDFGVSWDEPTDHLNGIVNVKYIGQRLAPELARRQPTYATIPELANYSYEPWLGFSAAAGIPKEIRDRLNSALRQSMGSPAVKTMLSGFGYRIIASSSSEMREAIQHDITSYRVLARSGRVTPE